MNADNIDIDVNVNTEKLDEAVNKARELDDILTDVSSKVVINSPKNCTFNITVKSTTIKE